MSLSRGGRGGLTKFLEKGTLSLSTEFFFDGFPNRLIENLDIIVVAAIVDVVAVALHFLLFGEIT